MLNKRITKRIVDNEIIGEQACYRQERSTFEHILTLLALVQKQLLKHKNCIWPLLIFVKLLTQYVEQNCGMYCTETALEAKSRLHYKVCMPLSRLEFVQLGGGGGSQMCSYVLVF